jgi:hypothetical protein
LGNRKAREYQKQQEIASAWEAAQANARGLTEDVFVPGIVARRLQLVVVPSFSPGHSWDIRTFGSVCRLFRSETVDESDDTPLMLRGYTELEASAVDLQSFIVRLRSLSLVIAPPAEGRAGLDGTTYHLALCGDFISEVRYRWWEEPPPNWRPLGEIVGEMIARFTNLPEKAG